MLVKKNLTIAVLTYHRPHLLKKCLNSILRQSSHPHQILIIDNDPRQSARQTISSFIPKLSIRYYCQPYQNISLSRNLALTQCATTYLAFVDDDCSVSSHWSNAAEKAISAHPDLAFFQGGSKNSKKSSLSQILNYSHQDWIDQHRSERGFDPRGIDTKNLIFNLNLISPNTFSFDPKLPVFEDIDFGLQLNSANFKGIYVPQMLVEHHEITSLTQAYKKYFFRGQIKYLLNYKWKNYDHFSPQFNPRLFWQTFFYHFQHDSPLNTQQKVVAAFLDIVFILGHISAKSRQLQKSFGSIVVLNVTDKAANQERADSVSRFLRSKNFDVTHLNTQKLFDDSVQKLSTLIYFPLNFTLYRFLRLLVFRFSLKSFRPYLHYFGLKLRGQIVAAALKSHFSSIVILQYPEDIYLVQPHRPYKIILDLPTIYSEELRLSGTFPAVIINKIASFEKKIFLEADSTAFHWYSFLDLAKNQKINFKHSFILNWGCSLPAQTSSFKATPQIVYLGKLNTSWINPSFLNHISQKIPSQLKVYSYEKPDSHLFSNLPYHGFLKSIDSLSNYQFGLITLSQDNLRSHGFSAKQLSYLSYGLPVLCPDWRQDQLLKPATIYYNEKNFERLVKKYSQKKYWQPKHLAALKLAQKLQWKATLQPLIGEIYSLMH